MSAGARNFWWFFAGFNVAGTLVNYSPGDPDWQPVRVVLTLVTLAIPTAGHWFMGRYRIRVVRRDELWRDVAA
jgi:hypothetical protein